MDDGKSIPKVLSREFIATERVRPISNCCPRPRLKTGMTTISTASTTIQSSSLPVTMHYIPRCGFSQRFRHTIQRLCPGSFPIAVPNPSCFPHPADQNHLMVTSSSFPDEIEPVHGHFSGEELAATFVLWTGSSPMKLYCCCCCRRHRHWSRHRHRHRLLNKRYPPTAVALGSDPNEIHFLFQSLTLIAPTWQQRFVPPSRLYRSFVQSFRPADDPAWRDFGQYHGYHHHYHQQLHTLDDSETSSYHRLQSGRCFSLPCCHQLLVYEETVIATEGRVG